ncbi:unnamed protein product, partial [Phaeothamnion confervicola]
GEFASPSLHSVARRLFRGWCACQSDSANARVNLESPPRFLTGCCKFLESSVLPGSKLASCATLRLLVLLAWTRAAVRQQCHFSSLLCQVPQEVSTSGAAASQHPPLPAAAAADLKELMMACWQVDCTKRPTFANIIKNVTMAEGIAI